MQTPVYKESMQELIEIYGNFSFLNYNNVTSIPQLEAAFMTSNPDARVFLCNYAGKAKTLKPHDCDLFHRSITNEGFGYSFNMANFWDIFSDTFFNKQFSHIMRPKGFDQIPSPEALKEDEDFQRWDLYPKQGIYFPLTDTFHQKSLGCKIKIFISFHFRKIFKGK